MEFGRKTGWVIFFWVYETEMSIAAPWSGYMKNPILLGVSGFLAVLIIILYKIESNIITCNGHYFV